MITQTLEKTSSDVNDLISVFHYLTQQKNHNITVILDSFYLVYEDTKKSPEFNEIVYSIRQVNPAKISFIFIANKEFDETVSKFDSLFSEMSKVIVGQREIVVKFSSNTFKMFS